MKRLAVALLAVLLVAAVAVPAKAAEVPVWSYDIRDLLTPAFAGVTAPDGQFFLSGFAPGQPVGQISHWLTSQPWAYNVTNGTFWGTTVFPGTSPGRVSFPAVGYRSNHMASGQEEIVAAGITYDIPYVLKAGRAYYVELRYCAPQVGATDSYIKSSSELGYWIHNGSGDGGEFYSQTDSWETHASVSDRPLFTHSDTTSLDVMVGADDVDLSVFMAVAYKIQSPSPSSWVSTFADVYPPLLIEIYDITPLDQNTQAIINAVEETGNRVMAKMDENTDRIVAAQDRTTNAINDMANRLDPQDKPALTDINPQEPEPLPEIPTIPGPEAVLGEDGVSAMQEIWGAFAESNFFKLVMVLAGVSIGIGIITYLARRKKEE